MLSKQQVLVLVKYEQYQRALKRNVVVAIEESVDALGSEEKSFTPEAYDALMTEGGYDIRPLEAVWYENLQEGEAFAQFHVRGISAANKKAFDAGEKTLRDVLRGCSVHVDLRWVFGDTLHEIAIVERTMDRYIRGMRGEKNVKDSHTQKMLLTNEEVEKEYRLSKTSAGIVAKYALMDDSFWCDPGEAGATQDGYGFVGTIWKGDVCTGVSRQDYHELFMSSVATIPELNRKLFDGKFNIKAFEGKESRYYNIWKSVKVLTPLNPKTHADRGVHEIVLLKDIEHFSSEGYKTIPTTEKKCA